MDLQQPYELDDDERKKYSFESPYPHQYFALPKNVVYYMAKTPSSVYGFLKLLQTCKYFFGKSQILPVQNIKQNSIDKIDVLFLNNAERITVNLKKLNHKLWIFSMLEICSSRVNLASVFINHVYQCHLQKLHLMYQTLFFGELQILFSGGQLKEVNFFQNIVKKDDGNVVEFEKVFEVIKCASLTILFADEGNGVGKDTAIKIGQIMENEARRLSVFFGQFPLTFDFPSFAIFLKKNMNRERSHNIDLHYHRAIPDSLKKLLQEFVDEIVQFSYIDVHSIPHICFPDRQGDSYECLRVNATSDNEYNFNQLYLTFNKM